VQKIKKCKAIRYSQNELKSYIIYHCELQFKSSGKPSTVKYNKLGSVLSLQVCIYISTWHLQYTEEHLKNFLNMN